MWEARTDHRDCGHKAPKFAPKMDRHLSANNLYVIPEGAGAVNGSVEKTSGVEPFPGYRRVAVSLPTGPTVEHPQYGGDERPRDR